MHFFATAAAGFVGLASVVLAQSETLQFRGVPTNLRAGETVTINYVSDNVDEPATLILRKGGSNDLATIETITTDATGGNYEWEIPDDLEVGVDYALQITQGSEENYTPQLTIQGGTPSAPTQSESEETDSAAPTASTGAPTGTDSASATASPTADSTDSASPTADETDAEETATATDSEETATSTEEADGAPTDEGDAATGLKSPLALVFGAFAVVAFLG